jgi:hypothetical protein
MSQWTLVGGRRPLKRQLTTSTMIEAPVSYICLRAGGRMSTPAAGIWTEMSAEVEMPTAANCSAVG